MAISNTPLPTASQDVTAGVANGASTIPKRCKAGVVHENGPNFKVMVEEVDVPEPGKPSYSPRLFTVR